MPFHAIYLVFRDCSTPLDALEPHLDAIVLVGAQAVYLHTADTDLAVAPGDLADSPLIGVARQAPWPRRS